MKPLWFFVAFADRGAFTGCKGCILVDAWDYDDAELIAQQIADTTMVLGVKVPAGPAEHPVASFIRDVAPRRLLIDQRVLFDAYKAEARL